MGTSKLSESKPTNINNIQEHLNILIVLAATQRFELRTSNQLSCRAGT
jgi:hypothetical protein